MRALALLGLLFASGCFRTNSVYCDATTACAGARQCDLVAHECVDSADLSVVDLTTSSSDDLTTTMTDLATPPDQSAPPDLLMVDMANACTAVVCTQNGAGNSACKTACKTASAKCGTNNRCVP